MASIASLITHPLSVNNFIDIVFFEAIPSAPLHGVLGIGLDGKPRMYEAAKGCDLLAAGMAQLIRHHYSKSR